MPQDIVPGLSSVLALLLADGPWLLEQLTLEAFTCFAEVSRALRGDLTGCCRPVGLYGFLSP